jgi:protein-S-isoprenylcysteine O-methyltransferase Ste14
MTSIATSRFVKYAILAITGLVGGGGLLAFILFLFFGPFNIVNLGLGEIQLILFDTFLCLVFFAQHSIMARKSFNHRLGHFLPRQYRGPIYAIASGIGVLTLVLLWQASPTPIISLQGVLRFSIRVLFFLVIGLVLWALSAGFLTLYRLQPIMDDLKDAKHNPAPLITRGPYRLVRHPLYLSGILLLWLYPDLTLDRLLMNLLFTVWIIAGTLLEERRLLAKFGDVYGSYQRKVSMLIPWRISKMP